MSRLLVAVLSPPFAELSYLPPVDGPCVVPGQVALVPMGKSLRVGVVLPGDAEPPEGVELKPMVWPVDPAPLLDAEYLSMVDSLAVRQGARRAVVLANVLPRGIKTSQVVFQLDEPGLPRRLRGRDIPGLSAAMRRLLKEAFVQGRVLTLRESARKEREQVFRLGVDPPWPLRPSASRQIAVLEYIFERGPSSREELSRALGGSASQVLRRLTDTGCLRVDAPCLEPDPEEDIPAVVRHDPSDEQAAALEGLYRALDADEPAAKLLHGVTGSGKTLVYMRLARRCLESGRNVLLLAPEVALACRLARTASRELPGEVLLYHGSLEPARREEIFRRLAGESKPVTVVGARSSLFLPLRSPGLIVLDEEHDESYKQEERFGYQAKEVAWLRVMRSKGLLVLGSATPDVKTYQSSLSGAVERFELTKRVGGGTLPDVRLVDASQLDEGQPLADESLLRLKEVVAAGEQAVVLLNRRGYAPVLYCLHCEETIRCPQCDVSMTFHKDRQRLVCHYCGLTLPFPRPCAKCGASHFLPMGEGTERLEEILASELGQQARVLRMDRDAVRRPERLEAILESFRSGRAQVLVGTQMLSKGHHFPKVTLVVAANADLGRNLPDYRAAERTFQLLVQASGRAGRGERPGEVLIQTRYPGNPFWSLVLSADYKAFFAQEIELRRRRRYPPFVKLALIRLNWPSDQGPLSDLMGAMARRLRELGTREGVTVLGPAPAPLSMLRGRLRRHCMLKGEDWSAVRRVFAAIRHEFSGEAGLRLSLDLEPLNML
jgi:primosomal protein N' (replication factor Y)